MPKSQCHWRRGYLSGRADGVDMIKALEGPGKDNEQGTRQVFHLAHSQNSMLPATREMFIKTN